MIGVCVRDQREISEREDSNKECPFARLLLTSLKPTTLHLLTCKAGFLLPVNVQHVSWRALQRCCRCLVSAGVLEAARFAYVPFVWAVYSWLGGIQFGRVVYQLAGLYTV